MATIQDEITTVFDGKKWRAEVPETYAAYLELSTCTEWEVSRHDCMLFRQDCECGCKRIILTNKTNKDDKYMPGHEDGDWILTYDKDKGIDEELTPQEKEVYEYNGGW